MEAAGKTSTAKQMLQGMVSSAKMHISACTPLNFLSPKKYAEDTDAPLEKVVATAPTAATAATAARQPAIEPVYASRVQ